MGGLHASFRKRFKEGFYRFGYTSLSEAVDAKKRSRFVETCLQDAYQLLGIRVQYTGDGPFRVLRDGNKLLRPFGLCNRRVHALDESGLG